MEEPCGEEGLDMDDEDRARTSQPFLGRLVA